jgi:predicted aspartyl protease
MATMLLAGFLLFSSALLNTKPSPVFAEVTIGEEGRYRFLVDTGSETSLIDSKLAGKLGLKPMFRTEIITQNTSRLLPGLKMNNLRIGPKRLPEAEVVLDDLGAARRMDPSVAGVLGINALAGLDFVLLPPAGRLEVMSGRPAGEPVPFSRTEDRIAIQAQMGRETLTLILDSGATHIVLFRIPQAMARTSPLPAIFGTLEGARRTVPTFWTAELALSKSVRLGTLPAAIVTRQGTKVDGLLPASLFQKVYVDQGRSEVVLVR